MDQYQDDPYTFDRRPAALPTDSPSGPPGSVKVVEFVLVGQDFLAISAALQAAYEATTQ